MFQYLGSRGAQRSKIPALSVTTSRFNTWAREEPNFSMKKDFSLRSMFQYLGSRGAQPYYGSYLSCCTCFNTWAREEPNIIDFTGIVFSFMFQYLGSRGAQHSSMAYSYDFVNVSILGLARSPTRPGSMAQRRLPVSILGLARSPTWFYPFLRSAYSEFQYLGSRGAQHTVTQLRISETLFQYLGSRGAQLLLTM